MGQSDMRAGELRDWLDTVERERPVHAVTPHGSYTFAIDDIDRLVTGPAVELRLREIERRPGRLAASKSNLVVHAESELRPLLENDDPMEREVAESILRSVEAFASYTGHSGSSHYYAVHILTKLLNLEALGGVTNDPAEWVHVAGEVWGDKAGEGVWQNRRQSSCFSTDGGLTYHDINEDRWVGWGKWGPWKRRLVRKTRPTPPARSVSPDEAAR